MQAWLGNVDSSGQGGLPMVERFIAAAEDIDTLALLTAGKTPRRGMRLGKGSRPLTPALLHASRPSREGLTTPTLDPRDVVADLIGLGTLGLLSGAADGQLPGRRIRLVARSKTNSSPPPPNDRAS